jgi:hypothetical protein
VTSRARRGLLLLAAVLSLLLLAGPASAAKPCGRQVLDDWNDGRIDGTYSLHCYDDAIELIPRDVRYYSSAEEDINRAMTAAMRKEKAPPNIGGPPSAPPAEPAETDTTTTEGTATPPPPDDPGPEVAPPVGSESVSSVPIPLLILAGLALLLVSGGSVGYLLRRLQSRRLPPPPAV